MPVPFSIPSVVFLTTRYGQVRVPGQTLEEGVKELTSRGYADSTIVSYRIERP